MCRFLLTLSLVSLGASLSPVSAQKAEGAVLVAAESELFSIMPKGPQWTRPAPTTWSSKAKVRYEARWGGDARYMV